MALTAALAVVGLLAAATLLQVTTGGLPDTRQGVPSIAAPLLPAEVVETLRLPAGVPTGPSTRRTIDVVTDGDLQAVNEPLSTIQSIPGNRIAFHTFRFDSLPLEPVRPGQPAVLSDETTVATLQDGVEGASFDLTNWLGQSALVVLRQTSDGMRVRVVSVRRGFRTVRVGTVPVGPARSRRVVALATWSGQVPDLFIIDWGGLREPATLRVFSGESGFRKQLLARALPVVAPSSEPWFFDVARLSGSRPDIILVKRVGESGKPEVHVLEGESLFTRFDQQLTAAAKPLPGPEEVTIGTRLGQVTAYLVSVTERSGLVRLIPLPYRANIPS